MARINIEECWWSDPRRSQLSKLLGNEYLADGCAVRAWRLAQEFWKKNKNHIPHNIFMSLDGATELLGCGLAKQNDEFVYVSGSSQYLDWTREKREAAIKNGSKGGKTSAKRPRNTNGQLLPKQANEQKNTKQTPSETKLSGSGSLSVSDSNLNINAQNGASAPNLFPLISLVKKSEVSEEDLESAYQQYPKKVGKSRGLTLAKKQIKTKSDLELFKQAIEKYTLFKKQASKNGEYYYHDFDTFMGFWRDCLEDSYGETQKFKQKELPYKG